MMTVTTAGYTLCASCMGGGGHKPLYTVPDGPENYPCDCDLCSYRATAPGEGFFKEPK